MAKNRGNTINMHASTNKKTIKEVGKQIVNVIEACHKANLNDECTGIALTMLGESAKPEIKETTISGCSFGVVG